MESKTCFILMPFTQAGKLKKSDLDYLYNFVIKKAVEDFELNGKKYFHRIERFESNVGSIIDGIIKNLYSADIVIADLTSLNPNVMYELGVRHSLKRGTIVISQDLKNLPSDLRDYLTVGYSYSKTTNRQPDNYEKFKIELHKTINEILNTDKYDSPVLNYFKEKQRFRNEDEIDKFKENAIIIDLILCEYDEIQDMLKALIETDYKNANSKLLYQLFNYKLNNLSIAINELKITHNSSIFYEQITNSKTILQEINKIFSLSQYYSSFNNKELQGVFTNNLNIRDCINQSIIDVYALSNGDGLAYTNMQSLFEKDGLLKQELISYLEAYVEVKSLELGIEPQELDKVLTS